jgi:hypothetical protein
VFAYVYRSGEGALMFTQPQTLCNPHRLGQGRGYSQCMFDNQIIHHTCFIVEFALKQAIFTLIDILN